MDSMLLRDQEFLDTETDALAAGRMRRPTTITVKVIANAPTTEIRGTMADGTLKIAVHAPRDGGKANDELCRFLAREYGYPVTAVRIVAGATSTRKVIVFSCIDPEEDR